MNEGAFLRAEKLKGAGRILIAAKHNRRAIQAELGAGGSIDASRCHLNESIAGHASPADVARQADTTMAEAGIGKLRHDAVRALEFVVSLPATTKINVRDFFSAAVVWLARRFGGADNILCADIHHDEAAPHLHVIVLPLIGGRMVGSDALGGRAQMQTLQAEFHKDVCEPYGLRRQSSRLTGTVKTQMVAAVIAELKRLRDPSMASAIWPSIRDQVQADPGPAAAILGIDVPAATKVKKLRSMTDIFISKGKGSAKEETTPNRIGVDAAATVNSSNPVGFAATCERRTLSCVGFAPAAPSPVRVSSLTRGLLDRNASRSLEAPADASMIVAASTSMPKRCRLSVMRLRPAALRLAHAASLRDAGHLRPLTFSTTH